MFEDKRLLRLEPNSYKGLKFLSVWQKIKFLWSRHPKKNHSRKAETM